MRHGAVKLRKQGGVSEAIAVGYSTALIHWQPCDGFLPAIKELRDFVAAFFAARTILDSGFCKDTRLIRVSYAAMSSVSRAA